MSTKLHPDITMTCRVESELNQRIKDHEKRGYKLIRQGHNHTSYNTTVFYAVMRYENKS